MTIESSFRDRWRNYRPSKALWFWSCVAAAALTVIVGFTWGGWVTGGSAATMSRTAAEQARAEVAATVCVDRFLQAQDAGAQLAALKDQNTWQRPRFIEQGSWATLPGMQVPLPQAARLCADRLAAMDPLPEGHAADNGPADTVVQ
jgi:hypothetical protein